MLTLNYIVYYSICNFLPKLSENTQKVRHDLLVLVSTHNLYLLKILVPLDVLLTGHLCNVQIRYLICYVNNICQFLSYVTVVDVFLTNFTFNQNIAMEHVCTVMYVFCALILIVFNLFYMIEISYRILVFYSSVQTTSMQLNANGQLYTAGGIF